MEIHGIRDFPDCTGAAQSGIWHSIYLCYMRSETIVQTCSACGAVSLREVSRRSCSFLPKRPWMRGIANPSWVWSRRALALALTIQVIRTGNIAILAGNVLVVKCLLWIVLSGNPLLYSVKKYSLYSVTNCLIHSSVKSVLIFYICASLPALLAFPGQWKGDERTFDEGSGLHRSLALGLLSLRI